MSTAEIARTVVGIIGGLFFKFSLKTYVLITSGIFFLFLVIYFFGYNFHLIDLSLFCIFLSLDFRKCHRRLHVLVSSVSLFLNLFPHLSILT